MALSKRLKAIARYIEHDAIVYDVGCDHALLSCFLIKNGIARKVYAGDNKKGPLAKAIENIKKEGLEDKVIPILADGLAKAPEDVDTVIIAGMGYHTAIKILEETDIKRYKRIIVQINKETFRFRTYLSEHNYTIIDEDVVYDDFYYEIIVFSADRHEEYDLIERRYGPILLRKQSPVFIDHLLYKKKKLQDILLRHKDTDLEEEIKEIDAIIFECDRDR